jgi:hypothetical protein
VDRLLLAREIPCLGAASLISRPGHGQPGHGHPGDRSAGRLPGPTNRRSLIAAGDVEGAPVCPPATSKRPVPYVRLSDRRPPATGRSWRACGPRLPRPALRTM